VGGTVRFTVNATVRATASGNLVNTATVAVPAGYTDPATGNNSATDTDTIVPPRPTLNVLDSFTRPNANNLGGNWNQVVVAGAAAIRVNNAQASDVLSGNAYWAAAFGATQFAAITISNNTLDGDSLLLKVSGGTATVPTNWVRVRVSGAGVTVDATANVGVTYTNATTLAGANFANGNVLEALIDANGTVFVWKVVGATTTFIGSASTGTGFTGGGRIGIQLPSGARVDDFAGGNVP
jgi:hypothetical protein